MEQRRQLLPILDEEPRPAEDVRNLQNCAEFPFVDLWRAPWDSVESMELARNAPAAHYTTDRVVHVGDPVTLGATMKYGDEPMAGEWVRIFVGSCNGWDQVGVKKTSGDGEILKRMDNRLSAGVYAVVYQSAGDATKVRGQLWVLPRRARVVAIDLHGAAFEPSVEGNPASTVEVIPAAAELSQWHARQGRVVVYLDDGQHHSQAIPRRQRLETLRSVLQDRDFVVGPVVDLGIHRNPDDPEVMRPGRFGEANSEVTSALPISTPIDVLFSDRIATESYLSLAGVAIDQSFYLSDYCASSQEQPLRTGWTRLMNELDSDSADDDPG